MKARLVSLLCLALCGCGGINVEQRAKAFHAQEAQRRIAAYEEARGHGDLLGMCVKANLVSAAYLDAGDSGDARAWDARRMADCKTALAALGPEAATVER